MKAVISMGGKSFQKEIDENLVYGRKIGEKIDGSSLGLDKFELQITGGSDKEGFPMKKGVEGSSRKRLLLSGGVGYKPKRKGVKRRKSVRGEVVSEEIAQLNLKVLKEGGKKFDQVFKEIKGEGAEEKVAEQPEEKPKKEEKGKSKEGEKEGTKEEERPKEEVKQEEKSKKEPEKKESKQEGEKGSEEEGESEEQTGKKSTEVEGAKEKK